MAELLQAVPVRRDRRGRGPLVDAIGNRLDLQIADDRFAVVIDVSGQVAQVNAAMRVQGPEIVDQIAEPVELAKRDLIDREADPDDGAAAGLDRDLLPLQHDPLREPVDRQGDRVADALAGDRVLDPLPSESQSQAHEHLKGVALPAPLRRRPGLAGSCPEAPVAQSGDELGGHAGAVVGDLDPALVDADVDFRQDRAGLLDRVQRIVDQLLDDRARPQLRLAAQALAQLGGADGLEIATKGERRPPAGCRSSRAWHRRGCRYSGRHPRRPGRGVAPRPANPRLPWPIRRPGRGEPGCAGASATWPRRRRWARAPAASGRTRRSAGRRAD